MMKLFDNLHLISDGDQFVLKEVRTVKKMIFGTKETTDEDVEKENVLGYFSTLTAAINHAVNYSIREQLAEDKISSLRDVIAEIDRLYKLIESATKGV